MVKQHGGDQHQAHNLDEATGYLDHQVWQRPSYLPRTAEQVRALMAGTPAAELDALVAVAEKAHRRIRRWRIRYLLRRGER